MRLSLITLTSGWMGKGPWGGLRDAKSRRGATPGGRSASRRLAAAPSLDSRWVVLVEDGVVVAPPTPCLFAEDLADLEAETAMCEARPGVTARVGTMRLLLSLPLGLRAEDFRRRDRYRDPCSELHEPH